MIHKFAALVLAALVLALPLSAMADESDKNAGNKSYTVTYDIRVIAAKKGAKAGEWAVKTIFDFLPNGARSFVGKDAVHTVRILNGTKLEILADKAAHEQIGELLASLRRLLDVAVVVDSALYEVDRKLYDEQIAGKLHRRPGNPPVFAEPATDEYEKAWLDGKIPALKPFYVGMKPLRTHKVALRDDGRSEILNWRNVVPYERSSLGATSEIAFVYPGVSFTMQPVVTPDRRRIQMRLTQTVREVVEWLPVKGYLQPANQPLKEVVDSTPVLREASYISDFAAMDGVPVVATVQTTTTPKGRVLVLVFTGRIRIEEEEQLIRKQKPVNR